jgi:ureidoglycolate dehydrogenase (NAD+)
MKTIMADDLQAMIAGIFSARGLSERDSGIAAHCLVHADLVGLGTHGVFRVAHYCRRLENGTIKAKPNMQLDKTGPATATLDSDDGLGHVAVWDAMDTALAMAKAAGVAFVGIKNSNHCGALAVYTQHAIDNGCIGLAFTQTDAGTVPFGGTEPFLGTNPLSIGIPTESGAPILLDMATSTVAAGHIYKARVANQPIPSTWALDKEGKPTTDPHAATYWTPAAGAKGYGLGVIVDVLTGILCGGTFGPHLARMYEFIDQKRNLSHLVGVLDYKRFAGAATFLSQVRTMGEELRQIKPAEGFARVMTPGEPEYLARQRNQQEGITLDDRLWEELESLVN